MKGPSQRLKFELRRLWECPVCQRRERAPGSVTSRLCMCQMKHAEGKPVVMKLVTDGVQRVVPPVVLNHAALETAVIVHTVIESIVSLPEEAPQAATSEAAPTEP
jgi:hypothetical protein